MTLIVSTFWGGGGRGVRGWEDAADCGIYPPRPAGKSDQGVADPQHGKMVRTKGGQSFIL